MATKVDLVGEKADEMELIKELEWDKSSTGSLKDIINYSIGEFEADLTAAKANGKNWLIILNDSLLTNAIDAGTSLYNIDAVLSQFPLSSGALIMYLPTAALVDAVRNNKPVPSLYITGVDTFYIRTSSSSSYISTTGRILLYVK